VDLGVGGVVDRLGVETRRHDHDAVTIGHTGAPSMRTWSRSRIRPIWRGTGSPTGRPAPR
jgi:hypothetical protein